MGNYFCWGGPYIASTDTVALDFDLGIDLDVVFEVDLEVDLEIVLEINLAVDLELDSEDDWGSLGSLGILGEPWAIPGRSLGSLMELQLSIEIAGSFLGGPALRPKSPDLFRNEGEICWLRPKSPDLFWVENCKTYCPKRVEICWLRPKPPDILPF